MSETIEITYTVFGFDEVGETSFDMDVSEHTYERLQDAEDDGETLDSDYISYEMDNLHDKILRAIRENMRDYDIYDPDDGMTKKTMPWGYTYKEKDESRSHSSMQYVDDDDIEYEISL